MKISIVTPAYNGSKYLPTTIESVLAQTFRDWEMVIVDDGSTDDSFGIAERYAASDPPIRTFRKENGGVATARNYGYDRTDQGSEYIVFLDQDDVWRPHTLERLLGVLQDNPDAVAAHGLTMQVDGDGTATGTVMSRERRKLAGSRIVPSDDTEPTTFATLICDCCIPTPGVGLMRRSAFERIKSDGIYFDQAVASGDDWDVWLRLSLLGPIAFVNEILLDWRDHADAGSKRTDVTFAAEARVRKKIAESPDLTHEQRRMAEWRYRRVYASIERRNVRTCRQWAWQSLRGGQWIDAARLGRAWGRRYLGYLGVRMQWTRPPQDRPAPVRLTDVRQIVDAGVRPHRAVDL